MHVFDYRFLRDYTVSGDMVNRISRLEGFNQRTQLLKAERESVLRNMERIAIVMSTRDSNAIEGIGTTGERLIPLISGNTKPISHSEGEIRGYSRCLRHIHENHASIRLSTDAVLDLYAILMSDTAVEPVFKTRDNVIIDRGPDGNVVAVHGTVPHQEVRKAMEDMIASYWEARNDMDINSLLLIPCFIVDFLRIHPFMDGNGRMSRLMTTLLLYQEGYEIGRYVSLESIINSSKGEYYDALERSEAGWFDNESDYRPFIEYFLGVLFRSYREYDLRLSHSVVGGNKTDAVRDILLNISFPMSKREIMSMLPEVSERTVSNEIRRMLDAGEIRKMGSTRNARYIRADIGKVRL